MSNSTGAVCSAESGRGGEEAKSALAALIKSEQQSKAEFRRTLYAELVDAKRKADGLPEGVGKATQRTGLQSLTSPVDGVAQQLAIHTVGGARQSCRREYRHRRP